MQGVFFNGSPRPGGNTCHLLRARQEELDAQGVQTRLIQLGGHDIRGCMACGKCSQGECVFADENFRDWTQAMYQADGVVFGTPVYYSSMNGTLKSFLDRAFYQSHGRMRHKVGAALAVPRRSGGIPAFDEINRYFLISEMLIAPSYYWNVAHGGAPGEVLHDEEGICTVKNLARNMAWMLKMKEASRDIVEEPQPYPRSTTNFIRQL